MLSKLLRKNLISKHAQYITCIDPRNFHLIPKPRAERLALRSSLFPENLEDRPQTARTPFHGYEHGIN